MRLRSNSSGFKPYREEHYLDSFLKTMGSDKDIKIGATGPRLEETTEVGTIREYKSLHVDGIDPVFENQARLVNHAVQAIGTRKYQWALFGLCGYGWLCDQLWQTTVSDAPRSSRSRVHPKALGFPLVGFDRWARRWRVILGPWM